MKRLFLLCLTLCSTGCATLERHPVWTAVGTAIIVGSIAASVQHHHDQQQHQYPCGPDQPNRSNAVIGSCVGQ
jgi:hypothetical protein